jgi:hypothetical protein
VLLVIGSVDRRRFAKHPVDLLTDRFMGGNNSSWSRSPDQKF